MTRRMSIFTGIVTVGLFGVMGGSFLVNGQYLFGGVLMALAAVRAFVLIRAVRSMQDRT